MSQTRSQALPGDVAALADVPADARHARERVVVAVSDGAGSDAVVRRAARIAQRSHAPFVGVRVRRPGTVEAGRTLAERRRLKAEVEAGWGDEGEAVDFVAELGWEVEEACAGWARGSAGAWARRVCFGVVA